MDSNSTLKVRRGRRPGIDSTRATVLKAARACFANEGFAATTIRRIAADAEVDVSQVMQFFGSKNELFAAVMEIPNSALDRISAVFDGPDEHLGDRVVRAFIASWETIPEESEPLVAMLRGAIVHENAREQLRDFIQSRLITGLGEERGYEAAVRAGLASSMLVGVIISRRVIGAPLLVEIELQKLVDIVGPAIQKILVP
jgi:AcrR family transcriptional regulator